MKKPTTIRLSDEAKALWAKLAKKWGLTRTSALEVLIRDAAKKERVK